MIKPTLLKNTVVRMLLLPALMFVVLSSSAQQTPQSFVIETNYLLYLPDGYGADTTKQWPLMVFLHGSGESGTDIEKVKMHGPPKLVEQGKKFPFIIVSPQAPPRTGWRPDVLYRLIQHVKQTNRVDRNKVYLTGLSMGGYGTWRLAMEHPEEFAAIAPVCGGGDTADIWKLRNIPIWCFHGAKDDVVYPSESERMVDAAKKYNPTVKYTLFPNANHNSWDTTYNTEELYSWLLSKSKFSFKETPINAEDLKEYEGVYTLGKDTIRVSIENNGLLAQHGNERFPLKPAGKDSFFIHPDEPIEIKFQRNGRKLRGFEVFADRRMVFVRK